jgi:chemotaxis protein MotB
VRGYADQRLRLPQNPLDPSNRRISLIVQYLDVPPPASTGEPENLRAQPASAPPGTATKSGAAAVMQTPPASQNAAARLLARLHTH